ncbi:hypothetical protein Peur_007132 [Populus x canadensis]
MGTRHPYQVCCVDDGGDGGGDGPREYTTAAIQSKTCHLCDFDLKMHLHAELFNQIFTRTKTCIHLDVRHALCVAPTLTPPVCSVCLNCKMQLSPSTPGEVILTRK